MEKITYVLEQYGDAVGVIICENDGQLMARATASILDNIDKDEDGDFEVHIGRHGDFGEQTKVSVVYKVSGVRYVDDSFMLFKTVNY